MEPVGRKQVNLTTASFSPGGKTSNKTAKKKKNEQSRKPDSFAKTPALKTDRNLKAESKEQIISSLIVVNDKIKPGAEAVKSLNKSLALYPKGCLELVKDSGFEINILKPGQTLLDAKTIEPIDFSLYQAPKTVASLNQAARELSRDDLEAVKKAINGDVFAEITVGQILDDKERQFFEICPAGVNLAFNLNGKYYYRETAGPGNENQLLWEPQLLKSIDNNDAALKAFALGKNRVATEKQAGEWLKAVKALNPDNDRQYLLLPDTQALLSSSEKTPQIISRNEYEANSSWVNEARGACIQKTKQVMLKEDISFTAHPDYGDRDSSTPIHEFAHALNYCIKEKDPGSYKDFDLTAANKFRAFQYDYSRAAAKAVSPYAMASLGEFKAESIRAFIDTPKQLKALDPEWYKAVKNLVINAGVSSAASSRPL